MRNCAIMLSASSNAGSEYPIVSVTAGVTGLLTNVEFYADVTSDRVYFFVNQAGRNGGPHLEATFVTGSFRAAQNANPKAYAGALYYRYGSTGWLGLGYDDDMMFRTYVLPVQLSCFPQVAIGGGYVTNFILLNNGATTTTGSFALTDGSGNPLSVKLTGPGVQPESAGQSSSLPLSIAPVSTLFLKAEALDPADVKAGWACLESDGGSFSGVATYELTEGGALKTTVGVLSSQPVDADDFSEAINSIPVRRLIGNDDPFRRPLALDQVGIYLSADAGKHRNQNGENNFCIMPPCNSCRDEITYRCLVSPFFRS